jgi:hypothetical protein
MQAAPGESESVAIGRLVSGDPENAVVHPDRDSASALGTIGFLQAPRFSP